MSTHSLPGSAGIDIPSALAYDEAAERSVLGAVLENARIAVELDPSRLADRWADIRLAAAVLLSPRVETCEALLVGAPVPAHRLDQRLRKALHLEGDIVLDLDLAYQVIAQGPQK